MCYSGFSPCSPSPDSCHSELAAIVGKLKFHPASKRQRCVSTNSGVIAIRGDDKHVCKACSECMRLDGSGIGQWIL